MGVVRYIVFGDERQVGVGFECDPPGGGQNIVGAGLVGGILRYGHGVAVGNVVKGAVAAGVQAGGHGGDFGDGGELRVLFLVEHLHVGGVLVNVEVDAALV